MLNQNRKLYLFYDLVRVCFRPTGLTGALTGRGPDSPAICSDTPGLSSDSPDLGGSGYSENTSG